MKKFLAIALAAVCALSCNKEAELPIESSDGSFLGKIEENAITRTIFGSDGLNVFWEKGDAILAVSGSNSMTFTTKDNGAEAFFEADDVEAAKAFHKSGDENGYDIFFGPAADAPSATIPTEIDVFNSTKNSNLPMYAYVEAGDYGPGERTATFHNVCGVLSITISEAAAVTKLTVESDCGIAGDYSISGKDPDFIAEVESKDVNKLITVDFDDNEDATKKVYVAVAPGTHNFTFKAYEGETVKTTMQTKAVGGVAVEAGHIYSITLCDNVYKYTYKRVNSLSEIKPGRYVIVASTNNINAYLPNTATGSTVPTVMTSGFVITEDRFETNLTSGVDWTFSGDVSAMTITATTEEKLYLYNTNGNNGTRVGNTSDTWLIETHMSAGTATDLFQFKDKNNNRFLGIYNDLDWRSYTTADASNYTAETGSSKIKLYKLKEKSFEVTEAGTTVEISKDACDEALIHITGDSDVAWTATLTSGDSDAITFTGSGNGPADINVNIQSNTGSTRDFVIAITTTDDLVTAAKRSQSVTIKQKGTWSRVSSIDTLLKGGTFIIGYEATANSGVIVPMQNSGRATTSKADYIYAGTTTGSSANGTIDMASITTETSAFEVTIAASTTVEGAICIKLGDNFLGNTNTQNNCKLFASEASTTAFTPTVGENDVFTLKIAANATYHTLQYNSGSPRFAVYGGTQKNVVIYKKN